MKDNERRMAAKEILSGVSAMFDQQRKETAEAIEASQRQTQILIEAQDKKLNAIAENLDTRLEKVESGLHSIDNRLETLENDMQAVKATVTNRVKERQEMSSKECMHLQEHQGY